MPSLILLNFFPYNPEYLNLKINDKKPKESSLALTTYINGFFFSNLH